MTDPTRRGFFRRLAGAVAAIAAAPIVGKAAATPTEGYAELAPALRVGTLADGSNGLQIGPNTFASYPDGVPPLHLRYDASYYTPMEIDSSGHAYIGGCGTIEATPNLKISSSAFEVESVRTGGTASLFDRVATLNVEQRAPDRIGGTFVFTAYLPANPFQPGDVVRMKAIQPDGSVGDCWATVDGRGGCLYAATMKSGTPGAVFPAGTAVVGYGRAT